MPRSLSCVGAAQKAMISALIRTSFTIDPDLASCSDRARRLAACIERILVLMMLCLTGSRVNARANIAPCTVVQGFFLDTEENAHKPPSLHNTNKNTDLTPQKTGIGVFVEVRRNLRKEKQNIINHQPN